MGQKESTAKIKNSLLLDRIKDEEVAEAYDGLWEENQKLQNEIELLEEDRDYLRGCLGAYIVLANRKDDCMVEMEETISRHEERIDGLSGQISRYEENKAKLEETIRRYENTTADLEEKIRQYESTMAEMDSKIKMFEGSRYYRFRRFLSRVIHGIGRRIKRLFGKKQAD